MQPAASGHDRAAPPATPAGEVRRAGDGSPVPDRDSPRIGPNAITRMAEAADARLGRAATGRLFLAAGLPHHLARPPETMVAEDDVARLHAALHTRLGADLARRIARDAGALTGDYLLGHRIPRPAQALLRCLPAPFAARVLAGAISRHAWTFSGSGTFTRTPGRPFVLAIAGCPICRDVASPTPVCDYYAATFERIFRALVTRRARVVETACQAAGAPACVFEARW